MIFTETKLKGAFIIDLERREDDARVLRPRVLSERVRRAWAEAVIAQANVAFNKAQGHAARACISSFRPRAETKLVRCTRGAILDIIVDLRPESPTYLQHVAVELDEDNQPCALRPRAVRPRIPGARGHDRNELPGRRVLHARGRGRAAATTTRASASSGRCR